MEKLLFKLNKYFNYDRSHGYINKLSVFYFQQIEEYLKSIEFNQVLDIPPDFQIELMILNVHIWMIINRLNDFEQNGFIGAFKNYLTNILNKYTEENIMRLHINKKNDFILDTKFYLENCQKFLNYHFRGNIKTSNKPIVKIDSLIWTLVFFEKVDRYDERVYLFSGYILEMIKEMEKMTIEDFKSFNLNLNPLIIPIDYKKRIIDANPQLSNEEMAIEKNKDQNNKKKYRYDFEEKMDFKLPEDQIINNAYLNRNLQIVKNIKYNLKKYQTLDSLDYFSQKEENKEKVLAIEKKYIWSIGSQMSNQKEISLINQDDLNKLRSRRNNLI